jgi:hypothetical protein
MLDAWLDLLVCGLLLLTIAHLFVVQRRLAAFRAERDRLQAFVTALDLTVERAETAIRRLKQLQTAGGEPQAPAPTRLRPRTPEELMEAARPQTRSAGRPAAGSPAGAPVGDGKGGLAALLKSVAGQN